jgi:putative transposase
MISFGILNKSGNIEQADIPNQFKAAILKVPYKYRAGTLKQLCTSWNEYVKSRSKQNELERGKPKYKRYRDRVDTIIHPNPNAGKSKPATKDACRIKPDDILVLPSFGKVKVKGLNKRWLSHETVPRVKTVKIMNRPSGWYIQLTGEFEPRDRRYRQAHGAIGIDSGWSEENWITTDRDCTTKPRWYREGEEKLAELQRQLDQKRLHRVILWLNHPEPE